MHWTPACLDMAIRFGYQGRGQKRVLANCTIEPSFLDGMKHAKSYYTSLECWVRIDYAFVDQRRILDDKMDAWNVRFQDGKEQFDGWERENEVLVGQGVLAGLCTA